MKKIPYGISDYKLIKEQDYYFIDKTSFIEKIEDESRFLMFLRPRRFGKSLAISMLHYYYDVYYKDKFNDLFKDTYILKNRTKEANSYLVLKFDFSAVDTSRVEESFTINIKSTIHTFLQKYKLSLDISSENPIDILKILFDYLQKENDKNIYILIDEYDNFSNKLLLENKTNYNKIIANKTALFKQFFTTLKSGTGMENSPIKRIFITGVTPMTSYDVTSGFNIGKNISLNPEFNDFVGVTNSELDEMIEYYKLKDIDMSLMQEWYNNYRFSEDIEHTVYNTDMALYYLDYYTRFNKSPKELIDINVRSDYSKLRDIIYTDGKLNGNFSTLNTLIAGESISLTNLVQDFSALNLSKEENFKSLLFYLGLITIKDAKLQINFKIPNETIKRIDIDFLKDSLELENLFNIKTARLSEHLIKFATDGDIEVFKFLADEIKRSTGIRDYIYNEQTVKSMYLAYLSLSPYYVIKSELELNKGFADIFLKPLNPYVDYVGLVELKYIKRSEKLNQKKVKVFIEEAKQQVDEYAKDELVTKFLNQGKKLRKVVLIFHGWELVESIVIDN
ncbi:MAG: AAA family ATPase [Campylobacterota bacterium]|nr:AAA family ATPase [Campylobacterota bacterium]